NNQNQKYPVLDDSIAKTYAKHSTGSNKNSLYDSYIRGIRWASNRITKDGVIAFVSNGSFIDGNAADGIRKTFANEFTRIFVYNLRGNARTSGEQRRKESGNVFKEGSRTQVAVAVLIKNSSHAGPADIQYRDIGDYLTREQKLDILSDESSLEGTNWEIITPNEHGDWINHRDEKYDTYQPIGDKATKGKQITPGIFENYSRGLETNRDSWVYNYSYAAVANNVQEMINFYNSQIGNEDVSLDPTKISWSRGLRNDLKRGKQMTFNATFIVDSLYRPYSKQKVYFAEGMVTYMNQLPKFYPTPKHENLVITLPGPGSAGEFYSLIQDQIPALGVATSLQCFALHSYEPVELDPDDLLSLINDPTVVDGYRRKDNITDATLESFQAAYSSQKITKEDIFFYVYGLLHSAEYKEKYSSDLAKMLPRIPKVRDFWGISEAGHNLSQLHLNYESVALYPLEEVVKKAV
ncbi:type ISP restriction/modification enzyme, partial [Glutamicibacter arilaitensis]|uniref:type ISP restriction/modification enzyme n=1 Tax=Glutamicibacter arilaitensis TaxID=256701 RepID=UPI003FCFBBB3